MFLPKDSTKGFEVPAAKIPRFQIEREVPFPYTKYASDLPPMGWKEWTDNILGNTHFKILIKQSRIIGNIALCRDLRVLKDVDTLNI